VSVNSGRGRCNPFPDYAPPLFPGFDYLGPGGRSGLGRE